MATTPASLRLAFPQWALALDAVVQPAIDAMAALYDEDGIGTGLFLLACSAWLYDQPFARDMNKPDAAAFNPYRAEFTRQLRLKGSAVRTPWEIADFEGYL